MRQGIKQDVSAPRRRTVEPVEACVKRRRYLPERYHDLDLGVPSDAPGPPPLDPADEHPIYYRGVHVASICVKGGGWRRRDRVGTEDIAPRKLLGFRWLSWSDRDKIMRATCSETCSEDLDGIQLSPIRPVERVAHLPPYRFHSAKRAARRSAGHTDDTWLYEKLTTFRQVSRRIAHSANIVEALGELKVDEEGEEADDQVLVRSKRDYLTLRVKNLAQVLATQLLHEKTAMKGSVSDVVRCCSYYLLSCGKLDQIASPKDVALRQLQLLQHYKESRNDAANCAELDRLLCLINFYMATFNDDIVLPEVTEKFTELNMPVDTLIFPPQHFDVDLDEFISDAIAPRVSMTEPHPSVLNTLRCLFILLCRHGDVGLLITAATRILSRIAGTDTISYIDLIRQRPGSNVECYAHLTPEKMEASSPLWLISMLERLPVITATRDALNVYSNDGEACAMYQQILSMHGLLTRVVEMVIVHDWLTPEEVDWVYKASENRERSACFRYIIIQPQPLKGNKQPGLTWAKKMEFLASVNLCLICDRIDQTDWGCNRSILEMIYRSLKVRRMSELEDAGMNLAEPGQNLKALVVELISQAAQEEFVIDGLSAMCILVLLKALNVPFERVCIIQLEKINVRQLLECCLPAFVNEVDVSAIPWYTWSRFINQNLSFHHRFKRIFEEPTAYIKSISFFKFILERISHSASPRLASIVNGSIEARFGTPVINSLSNLWACALLSPSPLIFWTDLDVMLANFARRTHHEVSIKFFSRLLPFA